MSFLRRWRESHRVRVHVLPVTRDLRIEGTQSLEQVQADAQTEQLFNQRVAANVARRIADGRFNPRNLT